MIYHIDNYHILYGEKTVLDNQDDLTVSITHETICDLKLNVAQLEKDGWKLDPCTLDYRYQFKIQKAT